MQSLETLRLLKSGGCAFLLIEIGKILAPALQHHFVHRQNLQFNYTIIRELNRSIDKTACLQARPTRIMKLGITRRLKNESARDRLESIPEPVNQIGVLRFIYQNQISSDIHRGDRGVPC